MRVSRIIAARRTGIDVRMLAGLLLFLLNHLANAAQIEVSFTALGGSTFRADYTLINTAPSNSGAAPLAIIDILFATDLYDENSLAIVSVPGVSADWEETILSSAPSVPAAYDVFALTGGVPAGQSMTGFAIQFLWLGGATNAPTSQAFEIYDPITFELLDTGMTRIISPVPLPAAFWMCFVGMVWLRSMRNFAVGGC